MPQILNLKDEDNRKTFDNFNTLKVLFSNFKLRNILNFTENEAFNL